MFDHLIAENTEPIGKWDGAFKDKKPHILLSLRDGKALQTEILRVAPRYYKAPGMVFTGCGLLVNVNMGGHVRTFNAEDLINDKFDMDKPVELYVEIEQGAKRDTESDIGDETENPRATVGNHTANARQLAMDIARRGETSYGYPAMETFFEQVAYSLQAGQQAAASAKKNKS